MNNESNAFDTFFVLSSEQRLKFLFLIAIGITTLIMLSQMAIWWHHLQALSLLTLSVLPVSIEIFLSQSNKTEIDSKRKSNIRKEHKIGINIIYLLIPLLSINQLGFKGFNNLNFISGMNQINTLKPSPNLPKGIIDTKNKVAVQASLVKCN